MAVFALKKVKQFTRFSFAVDGISENKYIVKYFLSKRVCIKSQKYLIPDERRNWRPKVPKQCGVFCQECSCGSSNGANLASPNCNLPRTRDL